MRSEEFRNSPLGHLVRIRGTHPRFGPFETDSYVPRALAVDTPGLAGRTWAAVANTRAALASLDASARRLPNPALLRRATLRREAQSTSALEGTIAPLEAVLGADDQDDPDDASLAEVLNYVRMAEHAFAWHADGRPVTVGLLTDMQRILVRGTSADTGQAGRIRTVEVFIGAHAGTRVEDARFVPPPPGPELEAQVRDVVAWLDPNRNGGVDPVIAAAMVHYQFETLHPFNDGNGRIGRLLIVLQLLYAGVLTEPTLTVSPWLEARRADYFDRLLAVSARGTWDGWIEFFADGLAASATDTEARLIDLLAVQADLKARVRRAGFRAENAMLLVDFALAQPIFTVRQVQNRLGVSDVRANELVKQLVSADILRQTDQDARYAREFTAPDVLAILLR